MFSRSWRRQRNTTEPEVWCRFKKRTKDGRILRFRVQTLTEEYYDDVFDAMAKYFLAEETFKASSGCHKSPEYIKKLEEMVKIILFPQQVSVVCVLDDNFILEDDDSEEKVKKSPLVGYNMCAVCCKGEDLDFSEIMKVEEGARAVKVFIEVRKHLPSIHDKYEVDEYLGSMGLCVIPEFRGMGISQQILLARVSLCREVGIKVTSAIFTAKASINCAKEVGFVYDGSVLYSDLEDILGFEFIKNCERCELLSYIIQF